MLIELETNFICDKMEEKMIIETNENSSRQIKMDKENSGLAVQLESDMSTKTAHIEGTEMNKSATKTTEPNQKEMSTKDDKCVMAAGSIAVNSVSAFLHPLVIMNISEHWTRLRAQMNCVQPIYGALIGKQNGRCIEIMNSFELVFDQLDGKVVLNREYYTQKDAQFKQVFPDLEFLGWYTAGEAPNESDLHFHQQICEINESPVLLKLNPFVSLTLRFFLLFNRPKRAKTNCLLSFFRMLTPNCRYECSNL